MEEMTASNLRGAFGGESMAHMRYNIWGDKAARDGLDNIARLFRAISAAEQVHAANHFRELAGQTGGFLVPSMAEFGLGPTPQNLQGGIDGESYEISQMYPSFLQVAEQQDEQGAVRSFRYALAAEQTHVKFFQNAKEAADSGEDLDLGPVNVCSVCGYTVEGEAPDPCPICKVSRDKFTAYTAS